MTPVLVSTLAQAVFVWLRGHFAWNDWELVFAVLIPLGFHAFLRSVVHGVLTMTYWRAVLCFPLSHSEAGKSDRTEGVRMLRKSGICNLKFPRDSDTTPSLVHCLRPLPPFGQSILLFIYDLYRKYVI